MSARVYLLTEGVHDVAFLCRILKKSLGFLKVDKPVELDPEWDLIVPKKFPHGNSLRPAVPVPTFHKNEHASVAVVNAEGIDRLKSRFEAHHSVLSKEGIQFDAVGIVLDADYQLAKQKRPAERFAEMADFLSERGLPRPTAMESVAGTPRTGIFVLPGAGELGTLEDVLLECADVVYPILSTKAAQFIDGVDLKAPDFLARDTEEIRQPSGRKKAVLAAMSAVLKPGKPIQASIEDHRWIEPKTLKLPRVAAITQFLAQLTGAPLAINNDT